MTGTARAACPACLRPGTPPSPRCPECGGLGYTERTVPPDGCTGEYPQCPVEYDPMVHGWECARCGRSGPATGAP